ncbi:molybdenum cofactor guanylyltransferase [Candidatus Acetothermia bacterium]|nr:molybdenum cofactor guanylyltransferase [Candidatus Acetothermia bacterium]
MREPRKISAIVLAGGNGERLGIDKARLDWKGESLLAQMVQLLKEDCEEVLIAVGKVRPLGLQNRVRVVEDRLPMKGPLSGLHAGLSAATFPCCLVVACDMPFLSPKLLGFLLSRSVTGMGVLACEIGGHVEPFPAVYPRSILPLIERAISSDRLSVQDLLRRIACPVISEQEVRAVDPELYSFINLNTPTDVQRWLK